MGKELFNYVTSKMSLYPQIMRGRQYFWNSSNPTEPTFAQLNNIPDITAQMIHDKQMNTLQGISNRVNDKLKNINDALFGQDLTNIYNQNSLLEEVSQGVMEKIFDLRESIYRKMDYKKDIIAYQKKMTDIGTNVKELRDILSQIKVDSPIVQTTIDKLDRILHYRGKDLYTDLGNGKYRLNTWNKGLQDFISSINETQGYLLEALGTQWFQDRIPEVSSLRAINTGKLNIRNSSGKSTQTIQDIMILDITDADVFNIEVEFYIGGKKQVLPLGQFLDKVQSYGGKDHIVIQDNTFEAIEALSLINVQAKSGKKQLPWNRNIKNQFTIGDLDEGMPEWKGLSAAVIFQMLQQLQDISERKHIPYIETKDGDVYHNIVNYAFSSKLGQLMNYSVMSSDNQYLLTPNGFISFGDRMKEILGEVGYIRLIGNINIDKNVLSMAHNIGYTTRG